MNRIIASALAVTLALSPAFAQAPNTGRTMVPNTVPASGTATPSGPAGGDLSGTYPNPSVATAQSGAHTWGAIQTFTLSPVFTDASGTRTALGLGTAAVQNASAFLLTANNLSDVTAATARSNLGLGTAATQATGTSGATVPFLNGANTWLNAQTFTAAPVFTDQSGSRTALGLGTAATQNTGTSGANIPLLSGANTWGAAQALGSSTATTQSLADNSTKLATTAFVLANTGLSTKFVSQSYDVSTANGTTSIVCGFMPTAVLAFSKIEGTGHASWGFADSARNQGDVVSYSSLAPTFSASTGALVFLFTDNVGAVFTQGIVSSYDANGLTVTWTKTGAPTGTAVIIYLCLK